MAHKKSGGSSRNGRDSHSKRLGVKKFGGENARWDGQASLMTKAEMNARARGLAPRVEETEVKAKPAKAAKVIDTVQPDTAETPAAEKPAKKAAAPKAAADTTETKAAPAKKAPAKKADKAGDEA